MKKFAKLFNLSQGQLLVYMKPDGEEDILHQIINPDSCQADMALTFKKKEHIEKIFDSYDEEKAIDTFNSLTQMFNEK